jgi:uncharacterized protein with GYD domain
MPMFVMLSKLTGEGRKTIKERPERISEVNKEIEKLGAQVKAQYATLGDYDFITLLEAANIQTIGKIVIELGSRGTLTMTTLPAMEMPMFLHTIAELKKSKK